MEQWFLLHHYVYDSHNHTLVFQPTPHSLFVLEEVQIRELLDIKVFVESDDDIRFIRRLLRDTTERERTIESVINQYIGSVKPMHEQFVEPTKKYADIIVPDGKTNTVALDLLITKINSILNA